MYWHMTKLWKVSSACVSPWQKQNGYFILIKVRSMSLTLVLFESLFRTWPKKFKFLQQKDKLQDRGNWNSRKQLCLCTKQNTCIVDRKLCPHSTFARGWIQTGWAHGYRTRNLEYGQNQDKWFSFRYLQRKTNTRIQYCFQFFLFMST